MFQQVPRKRSTAGQVMSLSVLIYHATVRALRKNHRNAVVGLVLNMMQSIVMVVAFYIMFELLGLRGTAVRGDFMVYIMTGIFLFLTHIKAVGDVAGSEGPASPMMQHAPMNTTVSIAAAALSALYIQVLSAAVLLFAAHVAIKPLEIDDPIGVLGAFLLAWLSGVAVGILLLSLRPWFPELVRVITTVYQRVNMIASGKFFLANSLPAHILPFFSWNPLFHTIDQARGSAFINYSPHVTSITYPIWFSLVCLALGMMAEFYTRRQASISWEAKR